MSTGFADSQFIARMAVAILFSRGVIHRFFGAAICAALICFVAKAQDPAPILPRITQDQLAALASRVADHIHKSQIDPAYTKLFVFDFSNQGSTEFTKLGSLLATRFSESLGSQANGFVVSDRKLLAAYMKENWMDPKDVQGEGVALAIARSLGASGALEGDLKEDPDHQLLLTIRLEGFGPAWADGGLFPLTPEMQTLLKEPLPSFAYSFRAPEEPGVFTAGVNSAGVPECIDCPPPTLTEIARSAKYNGTIVLSVVVTQNGNAESPVVLKGAPFDLNKEAIETVRKWKFKPAQRNGKAVSVRVPIEITFRIN